MTWIICALIAAVLGFMIYGSIEDELPESLALLKSKDAPSAVAALPSERVADSGWLVRVDGSNVEIEKAFQAGAEQDGLRYAAPRLAFLCSDGALLARIDTQARTTGRKTTPIRVGSAAASWEKAVGTNVLAPNAKVLLSGLRQEGVYPVEIEYAELGRRVVAVDTAGLNLAIENFPAACKR